MIHLNGVNRHKIFLLDECVPATAFDGYLNFNPNGWTAVRWNETIDSIKKSYLLFQICETGDGRLFWINSDVVVEFRRDDSIGDIVLHPSTAAPFWAKQTVKVYTVAAKGFDVLYLLRS